MTTTRTYLTQAEIETAERVYGGLPKARLQKAIRDLYRQIKEGTTEVRRGRSAELLLVAGRAMDVHLARKYAKV
jgi:hypothetical protein